jgi:ELWxxDGT repeat protein
MGQYTSTTVQATKATPGGLSAGLTYYCQVAAKDEFGNISLGSNVLSFSLLLGSPTLLSPANGAVVLPGDINCIWQGPAENLAYHLTVASNSQLASPLVDLDLPPNTSSYLLTDLEVGQTYYWQVSALDSENLLGPPSERFSFTPGKTAMKLIEPQNHTVLPKEAVRMRWDIIPLADTQYRVTISTAENLDNPIDRVTTSNAFFTSNRIKDGVNYMWQVERLDSSGKATHISPRWQFGTLAQPELTTPANNSTQINGDFEFSWQNSPNNGYQIVIATDDSLQHVTETATTVPESNTYQTGTLSHATTYYWQVSPLDSGDLTHDAYVSQIRCFKTLGEPPSLISPANNATIVKIGFNFEWSPVVNVDEYTLYVSENSNPTQSPALVKNIEPNSVMYQLSEAVLVDGREYYWQVIAKASSGQNSLASSVNSFKTVISHQADFVTNISPLISIAFGNYLYFCAYDDTGRVPQLYRTDGSEAGTIRIGNAANVGDLIIINQSLYFSADNDATGGSELCRIDDPDTPTIYKISGTDDLNPHEMTKVGNYLLFHRYSWSEITNEYIYELWQCNLSESQTASKVKTFTILNGMGYLSSSLGDTLLFMGRDRDSMENRYGLWAYTPSDDPNNQAERLRYLEIKGPFIGLNDFAVFVAALGEDYELWRTNGAAVTFIKSFSPGRNGYKPHGFCQLNGYLYFFANDDPNQSPAYSTLWRTDGTADGTIPVEDSLTHRRIIKGNNGYLQGIAKLGDHIYFRMEDDNFGNELVRSDGTYEGTHAVLDIWPGPEGSQLRNLDEIGEMVTTFIRSYDKYIYFSATDPTYGEIAGEIWRTDGTANGTSVIEAFQGPTSSYLGSVGFANHTVYFTAGDLTNGRNLWKFGP